MTTTDLKPGDLVRHPERGYGVVLKNFPGVPTIYFAGEHGYENTTRRFTGWERAESAPPADEKPTNATVTLPCPDCGEPITNTAMVEVNREGERYLDFCNVNVHTCPPAQPDEPTEFGARIVVTLPDGTREKWLRSKVNTNEAWRAGNGSEIGWFSATTWDNVIERGTVTLGWDDGEQP